MLCTNALAIDVAFMVESPTRRPCIPLADRLGMSGPGAQELHHLALLPFPLPPSSVLAASCALI